MKLVIGGSGSGKSALAESLFDKVGAPKYYLATMQLTDAESYERARRHRQRREGKGFVTIEAALDLKDALSGVESGAAVLLECATNLLANVMFEKEEPLGAAEAAERAADEIRPICDMTSFLVVVTNDTAIWQGKYEGETGEFIRAQELLNGILKRMAKEVISV